MAAEGSILVELGIIAGSALALSLITWMLHLPVALGQLIAGMIIGPYGLKLVTNISTIGAMAEIGIVLLLFIVGLELDPFELVAARTEVVVFSFTEITASFLAGLLAGLLMGWNLRESILLAGVVCISSTALVIRSLRERGGLTEASSRVIMSALIIEDVIAVLILSIVPGLAAGTSPTLFEAASWIIRGALLVFAILVCGLYLAPRIIDRISQLEFDLDEAGFLLSISLGFAMAVLSSVLGFPAATGAFLMGLVILGKRARFVRRKIRPVHDLFLVIFFVSMGMLVDPSEFLNLSITLPIIVLALVGKYGGSYLGATVSGLGKEGGAIGTEMTPRGEFSFIIAREASLTGAARTSIYPIAGSVVLATTLVSALAQIPRIKNRKGISWRTSTDHDAASD